VVRQSCNSLSRRNLSAFWPRLNLEDASVAALCNPAVSRERLALTRRAPCAADGELVPLSIPSAARHALRDALANSVAEQPEERHMENGKYI
jgi:hypothetical protein